MLTNEQLIAHLNQKILIYGSLIDDIRELQRAIAEVPDGISREYRRHLEIAVDDTASAYDLNETRMGMSYVRDVLKEINGGASVVE